MSYAVQTGLGGLSGWNFLNRTQESQKELIALQGETKSLTDYFSSHLAKFNSTESIMTDYRARKFVLTAFGLQDDINNIAFVKKVMSSDVSDTKSFVNRLADKRYLSLANFFTGMLEGKPISKKDLGDLVNRYIDQKFEIGAGESDPIYRIALSARRDLAAIANDSSSDEAKWYKVIGNVSLRKVFEGFFNLGSDFAKLPIERQHDQLSTKAESRFGTKSLSYFSSPDNVESLLKNYIVKSNLRSSSGATSQNALLQLISGKRSFWRT